MRLNEKWICTLLLVCIIHPDLKDGWPFIAQQGDDLSGLVQFVNAAAAVLIPKEKFFVMT